MAAADAAEAAAARARWADAAGMLRLDTRRRPAITVAELLAKWLVADHSWRPATVAGYRSTVGFLRRDLLGVRRGESPAVSTLVTDGSGLVHLLAEILDRPDTGLQP